MAQESEVKLTVGGEGVDSKDVTKGMVIDMKDRDPESLHDDMRVGTAVVSCSFEPPHHKTNKITVRPAKTQISLGIRPV